MHNSFFEIKINTLHWIKHEDDPDDLCAHGSVSVRISDKIIVDINDGDGWTLSATALNLLRTLETNYKPGDFAGQLIPCCGFFLIANESCDHVDITGCSSGFDWTVEHEGELVRHISETGEIATISQTDYIKMVLLFVDTVKQFYVSSRTKNSPVDEFDRKGYQAFWTEWNNLRSKWT